MTRDARWSGWARDLASPWPIAAVLVLATNDHVAKSWAAAPRWLTGKASDVAGLFFFPLLLAALVDGAKRCLVSRHVERRVSLTAGMAILTGCAFSAIKLSGTARSLAEPWLGSIAPDPTDLVALPMLALSVLFASRSVRLDRDVPTWARAATVLFAASASLATSAPRQTRPFPVWSIESDADRSLSCGGVHAWMSKSGKEGAGLSLLLTARDGAVCTMRVVEATLQIAGGPSVRGEATADVTARPKAQALAYVPFVFDEEGAWNDGRREGRVVVRVATDAGEVAWSMPATHRYERVFAPAPSPSVVEVSR
jgi:hypothetical protein